MEICTYDAGDCKHDNFKLMKLFYCYYLGSGEKDLTALIITVVCCTVGGILLIVLITVVLVVKLNKKPSEEDDVEMDNKDGTEKM